MNPLHDTSLIDDYERDGVIRVRSLFSAAEVSAIRAELERYMDQDLASRPADARTFEPDRTGPWGHCADLKMCCDFAQIVLVSGFDHI